tara:strand:- start:751 stop:1260 length:510 start_codon:yes stop_codon:yes gene_type:complete
MNFLEKDLENIVFETDNNLLQKRGLYLSGKKMRQVNIGNYGICDVVCIERDMRMETEQYDFEKYHTYKYPRLLINMIELKKDEISANSLLQAVRYCRGIESYICGRNPELELKFSITLIGKVLVRGDFCYLPDVFGDINLYTYKYSYDGISFNRESGYTLINEGFKNGK